MIDRAASVLLKPQHTNIPILDLARKKEKPRSVGTNRSRRKERRFLQGFFSNLNLNANRVGNTYVRTHVGWTLFLFLLLSFPFRDLNACYEML